MEFIEQSIPGVFVIEPKKFGDARGYFMETYRQDLFEQHVGKVDFVQDNESRSSYGVLRGLHFQKGEFSQAKLVRVLETCTRCSRRFAKIFSYIRKIRRRGIVGRECTSAFYPEGICSWIPCFERYGDICLQGRQYVCSSIRGIAYFQR